MTVAGEDRGGGASLERVGDEDPDGRILESARMIISRLSTEAAEQGRLKKPIEKRWLEDLRNYYGRYTEDTEKDLEERERSTAFVKLTRHKTNGWAARLSDLLFPTDDKNYAVEPTPLPKLAKAAKDAVEAGKRAADQATTTLKQDPARAEAIAQQANAFGQQANQSQAVMEEAKKCAERMEEAIDDQLVQSDYVAQARDAIEDGCRIGTGIIKGPLTSMRTRREWRPSEAHGGQHILAELPDPQPEARRIDPWHFFPDMSARTIQEAEFTYERSLPTKRDLRKMALKFDFNRPAVKRLLNTGPTTLGMDVDHIVQLREITGEGEQIKDRYIMWEYHGSLELNEVGVLLRAAGQDQLARQLEDDGEDLEEYRCIIFFIGDEVLKIIPDYPLDSGETLYSVWNFEKGETSIFGFGVPHIMADSQSSVNGAWRMMMDNSGLSVGPQILINKDLIEPEDGSYDLKALKTWLYSTSALQNLGPNTPKPFEVFNIPNNQQQLAGIIALGKEFADEETSMPLIAQGEAGATVQPVGTTSMLFNSANVVFRRVVKSWDDDVTKTMIRRFYDWNMQNNPDEEIKGDMQVDARGTSVLLVRELNSQNLLAIANTWTVHPVMKHFVKTRATMVKTIQTMMIKPDDILFTQEEGDANIAKEQEMLAKAQSGQQQPVDNRLEVAKLDNETRQQIVMVQRDIKMMELAMQQKMTLAEVNAQLESERIKTASQERRHAADIAVEQDRGRQALQEGKPEAAGTGVGVG